MINFTKLNLTLPSGVTERMLECSLRNTPLEGLGETFIKIESIYKINALYLCAHAILESKFGKKEGVEITKNIYNIKYKKNDGTKEVIIFDTYKQCIETMSKLITQVYFSKEEKQDLESICKYYSPNHKRWVQDVNAIMNKIVAYYEIKKRNDNFSS